MAKVELSARASKYRRAELKPVVTQAASKMPSTATVLGRSQTSSARAVARDLTEPLAQGHLRLRGRAGDRRAGLRQLQGRRRGRRPARLLPAGVGGRASIAAPRRAGAGRRGGVTRAGRCPRRAVLEVI